MTFKQLQDEVLAAGFSDAGYRPRVKDWLNNAQADIARQLQLRVWEAVQTINLIVGTASYALPTDLAETRYVADLTNDVILEPIDADEYDQLATQNGNPELYSARGANLLVWPTPQTVYALSHNYWRLPATLSADGDIPELPADPYHDLLVSYATARAFRRQNDLGQAAAWMQDYKSALLTAGNAVQDDTGTKTPKQIPGAW